MKRDSIYELINILNTKGEDGLYEYFGLPNKNDEKLWIEIRNFAKDINERDYEYIKSQIINNNGDIKTILIILIAESNLNKIFKLDLIENREEYGIPSDSIPYLIVGIGDPDYTKEYIEKRVEDRLNPYSVVHLITTIGDPDYTKKCIEKREEYKFNYYHVTALIKSTGDPDYIKECIEKKEEYRLNSFHIVDLIKSIGDPDYTKKCIEKREEYGFSASDVINLITSIGDPDYIKECIEKREEYGFDSYNVVNLIKSIGNPDYIKKCIKKREEYGFNSYNIVDLIASTGDPKYIKECITNNEENLSLQEKIELLNEKWNVKYLCKEISGEYIFTDVIPEDKKGLKVIDIEHIGKILFDFKLKSNADALEKQVETLTDSEDILEKLERNNFSLPYIYIEQLNNIGRIKQFCNESDFRFFKSEFPKINEELLKCSEEERLDFFKFATVLGCFSKEKILDKNGRETNVILAQKACSLLVQLLKTEEMPLR